MNSPNGSLQSHLFHHQRLKSANHETMSSPNTTSTIVQSCDIDVRKVEFPLLLFSTLAVNFLSLAVLLRMRGTCDTLDHYIVSLLNVNDLITTGLYAIVWISGWASCNRLLQIRIYCSLCGWLGSSLLVWSSIIIIIITICRFLSLVRPLYYRAHVNTSSVTQVAVGALIFCLIMFLVPFTGLTEPFVMYRSYHICGAEFSPGVAGLGQRVFIGLIGMLGCATCGFVVVCNMVIVKTLRRRHSIHSETASTSVGPHSCRVLGKRRIFGHVTLAVSFVFALCYTPFVIRIGVDTINNVKHEDSLFRSVSTILLFLSPFLNPLVYGVFNKQFRATLITLLKSPLRKLGNQVRPEMESGGIRTNNL